jgi:hypothetical protein
MRKGAESTKREVGARCGGTAATQRCGDDDTTREGHEHGSRALREVGARARATGGRR